MFSSVLIVFFGLLSLLFLFVSGLVVDPEFDDPELEPELVLEPEFEPVPELVLEPEFPSEGGGVGLSFSFTVTVHEPLKFCIYVSLTAASPLNLTVYVPGAVGLKLHLHLL